MKAVNHLWVFLLASLVSMTVQGQWSEKEVLERIQSLQIDNDDFYDSGLFATQRSWSFSRDSVEDNTIFFTASIISTLRQLRDQTSEQNQEIIDEIIKQAESTYQYYRSRNGEVTHNFWQTVEPDLPFPNGGKLISNKKMRLPDDYDTSILVAQALNNDSLDLRLREKMVAYATREERDENRPTTPKPYRESKAYEVWYAKKMPQTFDICVLSNILHFVFERGYELNATDSASIDLIKQMILNEDHLNKSKFIAYHAPSPALILYHVVRMMSAEEQGYFDEIRKPVIEDLHVLLEESENEMEKLLLLTSLIRLDETSEYELNFEQFLSDEKTFAFFSIKPFGSGFSSLKMDGLSPVMDWYNEAYNWTLYLEYLILSKD